MIECTRHDNESIGVPEMQKSVLIYDQDLFLKKMGLFVVAKSNNVRWVGTRCVEVLQSRCGFGKPLREKLVIIQHEKILLTVIPWYDLSSSTFL